MPRIADLHISGLQSLAAWSRPRPSSPEPATTAGPASVVDRFEISAAGRERLAAEQDGKDPSGRELSEEEKQQVEQLKARDREVRAHEQAHLAALGGEGGSAKFSYETGPDGNRYAVEGEVPVSIGSVPGDPRATIEKARRVARAAVAPAQPSGADQRARARAQQVEAEARQKLAEEERAKLESGAEEPADGSDALATGGGEIATAAVDSSQSAALGLIEGFSAPAQTHACGVCHPSRQAGAATPAG